MNNLEAAFAHFDAYIARQMETSPMPGLAVALTDRERLLRVAGYGFADRTARTPVTPGTLFEIGSIGKSFTSLVLLQEHTAGRLDLHAPVTDYLPWFQVQSNYPPITLHHLLSHTAGIITGSDFAPSSGYEVWALRETATCCPPGTFFHYSNAGYKALGLALEAVLGQSYAEIIQERILDPLEMRDSAPTITNAIRSRLAVGYSRFYDDRPLPLDQPLAPATWLEYGLADGSIAATAGDMAAYVRMLLNRGQGPNGPLLAPEGFALMTQRVTPAWGDAIFYGYGLIISEFDGLTTISHAGGMVGYSSMIMADMDNGLGVVTLVNVPSDPSEIARFALQTLRAVRAGADLPALPPRPDRTRIANAGDYAGTYTSATRTLRLEANGERLILHYGAADIVLEQRGPDAFYVDHPDFALFLLRFGREAGQVVEAFHGADWYTGEAYAGLTSFAYPQEWLAYPGHYRSHNPWFANIRVVLRKGELALIYPGGDEAILAPLGHAVFRIGADERSPERIRFDTIVEGAALRATISGCDYYRFFTP